MQRLFCGAHSYVDSWMRRLLASEEVKYCTTIESVLLLDTIPGVGRQTAEMVVSEISVDEPLKSRPLE